MDATLTRIAPPPAATAYSTTPTTFERVLGWLSLALLAIVVVALARGYPQWGKVPRGVWAHLATVMLALALTPAILWHPRGTRRHRVLGYTWVGLLAATALISFGVQTSNPGHFSVIHLISLYTLGMLVPVILFARRGQIRRHRRAVRGLIIGALLVAGFFTLPFGRMLGSWLFG